MNASPAERDRSLSDWFDAVLALDAESRAAQLDALPDELASRLRGLLAADAAPDADIDAALRPDAEASIAPDISGQRIGTLHIQRRPCFGALVITHAGIQRVGWERV